MEIASYLTSPDRFLNQGDYIHRTESRRSPPSRQRSQSRWQQTGSRARAADKATARPSPEPGTVYQLKVTLRGSQPAIWRRLQVSASMTLWELHHVLQVVMGWHDSHMHQFRLGKRIFERQMPKSLLDSFGYKSEDETKTRLTEVARRPGSKFIYEYDMGNSWEHQIVVEKILPSQADLRCPLCLDGRRACPPEDCGGIWGYDEVLAAIEDPTREGADELLEWLGEGFDPELFDPEVVNQQLAAVRAVGKNSGKTTWVKRH